MAQASTKATRRSLESVVTQTLRLLKETPPPFEVPYIIADVEFDQDVEHDRTTGLDLAAEARQALVAGAPIDASVDVGFSRENQRSGTGGVTGRFRFRIQLPGSTAP